MAASKMLVHFTATVEDKPLLELPFSLVSKHLCSGPLIIQTPKGPYHVQLDKRKQSIYIAEGWREIEKENGMKEGDILFCQLFEQSELRMGVIDDQIMHNIFSCARKIDDPEKDKKGNANPHSTVNLELDDVLSSQQGKKRTFTGKNIADAKRHKIRDDLVDLDVEAPKRKKQIRAEMEKRQKISTEVQAHQKRLEVENPSVIIKFTPARLYYGRLDIPRSFADKIDVEHGQYISAKVPGSKSTDIKWLCKGPRHLGSGWREFNLCHCIEEGDMALLELTSPCCITFHIYRYNNLSTEKQRADLCEDLEAEISFSSESQRCSNKAPNQSISSADVCSSQSSDSGGVYLKSSKQTSKRFRGCYKFLELKEQAEQYAQKLSNPYFSVRLTESRLKRTLKFDDGFICQHMSNLKKDGNVTFYCSDTCTHALRWTSSLGFSKGWNEFKIEHCLKPGDILLLELLDPKTLKVHLKPDSLKRWTSAPNIRSI